MKPATFLLFAFISSTCTAAFVDQQSLPAITDSISNTGASNRVDWAQTFTVGITGQLTGFELWIDRNPVVTLPLLFDIRTTESGNPTESDSGANILAQGLISADMFSTGMGSVGVPPAELMHVDLADPFPVQAGEVLAIVFRSDDPGMPNNGGTYHVHASTQNPYPAGRLFSRTTSTWRVDEYFADYDSVFKTFVVPEPAGANLVGILGLAGLGLVRWRQAGLRDRCI